MSRTLLVFAAALCAAAVTSVDPVSCYATEPSAAELKIEEALRSETNMDFPVPTPLQEVIEYLKDLHGIEIQLDTKALDDIGMDSSTEVTKQLKGLSLESALNLLLRDLQLTYMVQDEVLLITTREEEASQLRTKVYPVGDLTVQRACPKNGPEACEQLIDVITTAVAADTWDGCGGPGTISAIALANGENLVISQSYHVHRLIAGLLDELRQVAGAGRPGVKTTAECKIEDALQSETIFDFPVPTPLLEVVNFIKQHHEIEVQLDTRALEDVGMDSSTEVTKQIKGVSLGSGLNLLLRDLGLTYVIRDEVLLITTPEEAGRTFPVKPCPIVEPPLPPKRADDPPAFHTFFNGLLPQQRTPQQPPTHPRRA